MGSLATGLHAPPVLNCALLRWLPSSRAAGQSLPVPPPAVPPPALPPPARLPGTLLPGRLLFLFGGQKRGADYGQNLVLPTLPAPPLKASPLARPLGTVAATGTLLALLPIPPALLSGPSLPHRAEPLWPLVCSRASLHLRPCILPLLSPRQLPLACRPSLSVFSGGAGGGERRPWHLIDWSHSRQQY